MKHLLIANLFFVFWTTFLNYIGTFLLFSKNFLNCFACQKSISWKTFIPFYTPRCQCKSKFIYQPVWMTLLGLAIFNSLYFAQPLSFLFLFIFASFLFITIRTDAETSLISRLVTLWPIPLFITAAYFNLTPVSFEGAVVGAVLGYSFLYLTRWIFFKFTGQEGMGVGDVELAACIGSAIGPLGVWVAILIGSISGTIFMISQNIFNQKNLRQIPFGPFLAIAAIIFCLFKPFFIQLTV